MPDVNGLLIRHPYLDQVDHPGIVFPDDGRTKQSHKAECDINTIVAFYMRTGVFNHGTSKQPQWGDFGDGTTFHEAQQAVVEAKEAFSSLPSAVRDRFKNDPGQFLDFVNDPENLDEAIELGLVEKPPAAPEPTPPAPAPAPEPPVPPAQ